MTPAITHPWTAGYFTGEADVLPRDEAVACILMGQALSVPSVLLAAIRLAENGRITRAFGILSIPDCDTYGEEILYCAQTIKNNFERFRKAFPEIPLWEPGTKKLSIQYIQFLANRYAPIGAANDPAGLNMNWFKNVSRVYYNSNEVA